MKPLLIASVGLPRSGKSTILRKLSRFLAAPIVQRDAIRLALHGQRYEAAAEPMVKAMSLYMVRSLFLAGHETVICDETNYSRAARDYMKDSSWDTKFFVVDTPPDVCMERAIMTGQPDLIPVIDAMYDRYEPLEPDEVRIDPTQYIEALG
jgi:tRNA uridine 5-carbamoylmethylation protein Kti12